MRPVTHSWLPSSTHADFVWSPLCAQVLSIGVDCDIALLDVEDATFWVRPQTVETLSARILVDRDWTQVC